MKDMLCPPESESVSSESAKDLAIKEIVKGVKAATQLQLFLRNSFGSSQASLTCHKLISKVLTSFKQAISVLQFSSEPASEDQVVTPPNLLNSGENTLPVDGSGNHLASGDCSEGRKRSHKEERGFSNRRWLELHLGSNPTDRSTRYEPDNRNDERLHERSDNERQNQGTRAMMKDCMKDLRGRIRGTRACMSNFEAKQR